MVMFTPSPPTAVANMIHGGDVDLPQTICLALDRAHTSHIIFVLVLLRCYS